MAFDPFASPESVLERGKSLVKSAGDSFSKQAKVTTQNFKQQVKGPSDTKSQATNQTAASQSSDRKTQEFIQDLYAPSKQQNTQQSPKLQLTSVKQQLGFEPDTSKKTASLEQQIGLSSMDIPKTPEEVARMNKAASELQQMHDTTYFKPTFVEKPKIAEQEKEQEKKQEEKQEQKRQQLEEQKKKEVPIALQQARNKIEMNRGASG